MRERIQNEKAVNNMLAFLREVNERCETGNLKSITWLCVKHEISKTAGTACKELKIVVSEEGIYKWVPKAPPGRHMALEILDNLLHRSKKKIDSPVFPDMAAFADKIVAKLDSIATQNENGFKGVKGRLLGRALPQASMAGNGLFSEVESKQSVKIDLLKSVLTGLYSGRVLGDLTPQIIGELNLSAVTVVDDVYNKFYATK